MLIEEINKRISYYRGLSEQVKNDDSEMHHFYRGSAASLLVLASWLERPDSIMSKMRSTAYSLGFVDGKSFSKNDMMWQRSNVLVVALVGKDLAEQWWNSPNQAFEGLTPCEMWVRDFERVYNYLMDYATK